MEDTSSTESEYVSREQLMEELEEVLKTDLKYSGSYYSKTSYDLAQEGWDPALSIEGVGPVALPLSEDAAKKIIEVASKAPYGRGEDTVIDHKVRNTWQIEPADLQFNSEQWASTLEGYVKDLCEKLGEPHSEVSPVTYHLHKMLLYDTGSHFLPHQDSEKAPGMFASMIIVLPSKYSGGQIHVQQRWKTDVIDLSSDSESSTSVLGWYTDVVHEVKPVTSGYRLALSYNLIRGHSTAAASGSTVDDMATTKISDVLSRWKKARFGNKGGPNMMTYILEHRYSESNLTMGLNGLKGKDKPVASCLGDIAYEHGFTVLIGHLSYHIIGLGRDEPDLSESDGDEDKPDAFHSIWKRTIEIENIFGLDGEPIKLKEALKIKGNDTLIPPNYFRDEEPDSEDYEPYMGNDGNNQQYWYYRSALMLFPEEDGMDILYKLGPVEYTLFMVKRQHGAPSSLIRKLVNMVLGQIVPSYYQEVYKSSQQNLQMLAERAVEWNDFDTWFNVVKTSRYQVWVLTQQHLCKALDQFGFDKVQPVFDTIIDTKQSFADKMGFISCLSSHGQLMGQPNNMPWLLDLPARALQSLGDLTNQDIDAIIQCNPSMLAKVLPQLQGLKTSFDLMNHFLVSLSAARKKHSNGSADINTLFDDAISQCLVHLRKHFSEDLSKDIKSCSYSRSSKGSGTYLYGSDAKVHIGRLVSLLEFAISEGRLAECGIFLEVVTHTAVHGTRLRDLLNPLADQVTVLLQRASLSSAHPPFSGFYKVLIGDYIQSLPSLPAAEEFAKIRRVGCGCDDCNSIDDFIMNTDWNTREKEFKLTMARRHHIENRMAVAEDMAVFKTVQGYSGTNPHGLQVTKTTATVLTQRWKERLVEAQDFLRKIGSESELSQIMGDKEQEVQAIFSNIARVTASDLDVAMSSDGLLPPAQDAATEPALKRKRVDGLE